MKKFFFNGINRSIFIFAGILIRIISFFSQDSNYVRRKKDEYQTAVMTLLSKDKRKKVIIVGTIHFARRDYFSKIQELADNCKGEVFFEQIGRVEKPERLSKNERDIHEKLKNFSEKMRKQAFLYGLEYQKDELVLRGNWRNADVSLSGLKSVFSKNPSVFFMGNIADSDLEMFLFSITNLSGIGLLEKSFDSKTREARKFLRERRNKIVSDAIINSHEYDVLAIWGADHMPGILKNLKCCGYKEIGREWLTFYTKKG